MILVTRYLLVSRVEHEVNNDLKTSLLGSDNISGLYKARMLRFDRSKATMTSSIEDIWCCLGVMSAIKESDSRSAQRFPLQRNSLKCVK